MICWDSGTFLWIIFTFIFFLASISFFHIVLVSVAACMYIIFVKHKERGGGDMIQ